jgi:hypothetical protein
MEKLNESQEPEASAVQAVTSLATFSKRKSRGNQNIRKKTEEVEDEDNEQSAVVKRAKQIRANTFTTKTERTEDLSGVQYDSSRAIQTGKDRLATAMLETETALDRDARCDSTCH